MTCRAVILGATCVLVADCVVANGAMAQDHLPSPLFCNVMEVCDGTGLCEQAPGNTAFVMRQTEDNWLIQYSARSNDVWVIMASSLENAIESAPVGAQVAAVEAGHTEDGAIMLDEYALETATLSARHMCWMSEAAAP